MIVAMPEALVMTGAVVLVIVVSALMNQPMPTEVYVLTPEKRAQIERNTLKGIKFTADGKMSFDEDSRQQPLASSGNSSP